MKRVVRALKAVAKAIGRAQTWLILTLFYFLLLAPAAIIFRCVADPLHLRASARPNWRAKTEPAYRWSWARAQS